MQNHIYRCIQWSMSVEKAAKPAAPQIAGTIPARRPRAAPTIPGKNEDQ